jgi:cytochrome c-type biogenesis protein CcmH/NrfF
MRRWKVSIFAALLAATTFAQTGSVANLTPAVKRVGMRLACLCGGCKNSVGDCAMLQCHYASPARERIAKMLAEGMSDDQIVEVFVKERGIRALVVPPAQGFHLLAWVMPFVAIALGLGVIWLFIRKFRRPALEPAAAPETVDRYRDRIEKDISKLD